MAVVAVTVIAAFLGVLALTGGILDGAAGATFGALLGTAALVLAALAGGPPDATA